MKSIARAVSTVNIIPVKETMNKQLYMMKFDVTQPIEIPKLWKPYEEAINKMLESNPAPWGHGYLTIDHRFLKPRKSQRRPGAHTDGNYVYGWRGEGWLVGVVGKMLPPEQHAVQYLNPKGGALLSSNLGGTQLWTGTYEGEPGQGGACGHIKLDPLTKYVSKPGETLLMNSTCIHDGPVFDEFVDRVLIRITLPANFEVRNEI